MSNKTDLVLGPRTIRQLDALLDRLDLTALKDAQSRRDALAAQRLVLDLFRSSVNAATSGVAANVGGQHD
jgi:hypothetical protein